MKKSEIQKAFELSLKNLGFKKVGAAWYKIGDVVLIVSLQKSKYDNHRYFEIGINFDLSVDTNKLKFYQRDIGFRLEQVFPENEQLRRSLEFTSEEESYKYLISFLNEEGGDQFLLSLLKKNQLKKMYQEGFFRDKMISNKAIEILSE